MIKATIKNEFSNRSTGNDQGYYYQTKGHAVNAFDNVLKNHGLHLDDTDSDFEGDSGRKVVNIYSDTGLAGCAAMTWYRMPSGNYEFIGYIAW